MRVRAGEARRISSQSPPGVVPGRGVGAFGFSCFCGLVLLILASRCAFAGKPEGDWTGPWQLFLDDYLVASKENVVRTYHPFEKHAGNPIKQSDIAGARGFIMYTPDDPDPARRYKKVGSGKWLFYSSPDGLHWQQLSKKPIFSAGDTGGVMWDPLTKKYRGYAKIMAYVSGQRRRAVGYSEDTGFENWPAPAAGHGPG